MSRKRTDSQTAHDDMMEVIAIHGSDDDFLPRNVDLGCLQAYIDKSGLRSKKYVSAVLTDKSPGSLYDKIVESLPYQVRIANIFSGRVEPWGRLNDLRMNPILRKIIMENVISSGGSGRVIKTKWFDTYPWLFFTLPFSDVRVFEEQLEKEDWEFSTPRCCD